MMFVMGIYPKPFLERIEPSVQALLDAKFSYMAPETKHGDDQSPDDGFRLVFPE